MLAVDVPYEANTSKLSTASLIYGAVLLYACGLVRINNIYLHHTKIYTYVSGLLFPGYTNKA